jgi:hypothetical protein
MEMMDPNLGGFSRHAIHEKDKTAQRIQAVEVEYLSGATLLLCLDYNRTYNTRILVHATCYIHS